MKMKNRRGKKQKEENKTNMKHLQNPSFDPSNHNTGVQQQQYQQKDTEEAWHKVSSTNKKKGNGQQLQQQHSIGGTLAANTIGTTTRAKKVLNETEVQNFLSTFKTKPCCFASPSSSIGFQTINDNKGTNIQPSRSQPPHDPRHCFGYHINNENKKETTKISRLLPNKTYNQGNDTDTTTIKSNDIRRNPYKEFYDLEDCINSYERMYHPTKFRTTYCSFIKNQNNNVMALKKQATSSPSFSSASADDSRSLNRCPYGKFCAHAHSMEDLRDPIRALFEYEQTYESPFRNSSKNDNNKDSSKSIILLSSHMPNTVAKGGNKIGMAERNAAIAAANYSMKCRTIWSEHHLTPITKYIPLKVSPTVVASSAAAAATRTSMNDQFIPEWFLYTQSTELKRDIDTLAFQEGLGCVEYVSSMYGGNSNHAPGNTNKNKIKSSTTTQSQYYLKVKGVLVDDIENGIKMMFDQYPSKYYTKVCKKFKPRILESLQQHLQTTEAKNSICNSNQVHIQVLDSKLQIIAIGGNSDGGSLPCADATTVENDLQVSPAARAAKILIQTVLDKIHFWIQQEGYDKYFTCMCCCDDDFNHDEGASCKNGHFICSKSCFQLAVQDQIPNIKARKDGTTIICPECRVPYETKDIARHLPENVWGKIQDAVVDKKVEEKTQMLIQSFDEKVNSKVEELLSKYGSADVNLRAKAESQALNIRNTILNLSCPHCSTPYAEFSGCMALQCSTCKNHFCGFCHHACATSAGAHDHVRNCLMNETSNSSYYANAEEILRAQKRYRTRELKKYIRQFKKDEQNAIVIELSRDLKDLGIDRAALFEFGNLQNPEELF